MYFRCYRSILLSCAHATWPTRAPARKVCRDRRTARRCCRCSWCWLLAMLMLCTWLGLSPRILGIVMHRDKPGWPICLLCIRTAIHLLQFTLIVHAVILRAGSSFFAAFWTRDRALGSPRSRLCQRCALLRSFLRNLRALSANSRPVRLTPSFGSCVSILAQSFVAFAPSSTSFVATINKVRNTSKLPPKMAKRSRENRDLGCGWHRS